MTINGGTGSWNYAGTLVDLAGGTAGAGSTLAIVKTGSNTQTFSRAAGNTYSRGTTISGGTLLVTNTSGSGLGVGSVDVQSGGAIGGTGIIALGTDKTVTIHNGGTITPGDGLGALRFNGLNTSGPALTLEAGSKIVFDLGAANASDQIQFLNYSGAADLVRGGHGPRFHHRPGGRLHAVRLLLGQRHHSHPGRLRRACVELPAWLRPRWIPGHVGL